MTAGMIPGLWVDHKPALWLLGEMGGKVIKPVPNTIVYGVLYSNLYTRNMKDS